MYSPVDSNRLFQLTKAQEVVGSLGDSPSVFGHGSFEKAVRKVFAAFEGTRDNPIMGRAIRVELLDKHGNVLVTPHDPLHK